MHRAAGYLAILMSLALLYLATAGASPAWAWNNATAGIVKDTGSGSSICTFHIQGSAWDASGTGTWDIKLASGGAIKASGTWTANSTGSWTTATITTLANGTYTLHVRQSTPAAGGDTSAVFTLDGVSVHYRDINRYVDRNEYLNVDDDRYVDLGRHRHDFFDWNDGYHQHLDLDGWRNGHDPREGITGPRVQFE